MNTEPEYFTAAEITTAYKKARLRYRGISLLRALNDPLLYKALAAQIKASRKQQHGTPAPMQQAA